ncbi:MAG: hypothetical protein ACFN06_06425 [Limosilactobacillus oris]
MSNNVSALWHFNLTSIPKNSFTVQRSFLVVDHCQHMFTLTATSTVSQLLHSWNVDFGAKKTSYFFQPTSTGIPKATNGVNTSTNNTFDSVPYRTNLI